MNVYYAPPDVSEDVLSDWLCEQSTAEGAPVVLIDDRQFEPADQLAKVAPLRVSTQDFPPADWEGGPVLAIHPTWTMLEAIENAQNRIVTVCVAQRFEDTVRGWLRGRRGRYRRVPLLGVGFDSR